MRIESKKLRISVSLEQAKKYIKTRYAYMKWKGAILPEPCLECQSKSSEGYVKSVSPDLGYGELIFLCNHCAYRKGYRRIVPNSSWWTSETSPTTTRWKKGECGKLKIPKQ